MMAIGEPVGMNNPVRNLVRQDPQRRTIRNRDQPFFDVGESVAFVVMQPDGVAVKEPVNMFLGATKGNSRVRFPRPNCSPSTPFGPICPRCLIPHPSNIRAGCS
jgi:hypothetical protein